MTLKILGELEDVDPNQGTTTYPDGEKYVVEPKDGKRNVQGTQTLPDGGKEAFPASKSAFKHLCSIISCE